MSDNRVIFKYQMPLPMLAGPHEQPMPADAQMVHAEYVEDGHNFLLWVEVAAPTRTTRFQTRRFQVWGTGDPTIPVSAVHVATGIDWSRHPNTGSRSVPVYVWHLYDVTEVP